jgi:chromosome segregation ATPase
VARTVAQLAALVERLEDLFAVVSTEARDLRRDLTRADEQLAAARKQIDEERSQARNRDEAVATLRQELAVLRQRFDDQARSHEVWANRAWGFFVVLIGAALSLASGLIVTLARR